ncbi:MAG: NAD(+) synthase, partial [Candidatus Spechtbacteria bacterium]|nr:NAD(+) synthase [Candidatus Spechtbacteria bacterium]
MQDMIEKLAGLKLSLCQMAVIPGRPDENTTYIVREIKEAIKRRVDIIFFTELGVSGYFIGDMFEDEAFLADLSSRHREIEVATKGGITAIIGTFVPNFATKGEDGRVRGLNSAVIYSNGAYIGHTVKTLQPNYRIFRDDRHSFSLRKIALEQNALPEDLLNPFALTTRDGRQVKLGLMLCEDMWHQDYCLNPGKILVINGADILCNVSCSPWTWQKNRKRHQIVKNLCGECHVPFVYVNNTGVQNTGKNFMVFDGASTVYNPDGEIVFEVPPYASGSHDLILGERMPPLPLKAQDDTKELYEALRHGAQGFLELTPALMRRAIIGLSGGIDSSLAAALWVDVLGPENVIGVNMPSKYNASETRDDAQELAKNLGIEYLTHPIQEAVDVIARATGVDEGTLAYENIQARVRMEVLAALAQKLNAFFPCNSNKVELAFGYGTQYGDLAGEITLFGDLIKREIYQVADYMNKVVFKREVIPQR